MRVWSLKMAIFASFVHCLPNILHRARTVGSMAWSVSPPARLDNTDTRQLSYVTTVNDLGHISRSLDCFASNLL